MRRIALVASIFAIALMIAPPALAGLNARKRDSDSLLFSGTYPVCQPVTVTRSSKSRVPRHASRVKLHLPTVGDQYGSRTHDPEHPWSVLGTLSEVKSERNNRLFTVTMVMIVDKDNPSSCAPGEPYNTGVYAGYEWLTVPSYTISYGMRPKYRFKGFIGDYSGKRQNRIVQGDYHSLVFRDRLGLRTRYRVCIKGDIGETRCWRRRSNSKGRSRVNASLFINDHTASGIVSWYVDGRKVTGTSYTLIPEGV